MKKRKILRKLKRLKIKLQRDILIRDINNCEYLPKYPEVSRVLNDCSIKDINKVLNLKNKNFNKKYTEDKLLKDLYIFISIYGYDWSVFFFNKQDWLASYQTYCNRFGNIEKAIKKAKEVCKV